MNRETCALDYSSGVINGVPIVIVQPTSGIEISDAVSILEGYNMLSPFCGEEIEALVKPGLLGEICNQDGMERLVHFVTMGGVYSLHYSPNLDVGKGARAFTPSADLVICAGTDLLVYSHKGDDDNHSQESLPRQ